MFLLLPHQNLCARGFIISPWSIFPLYMSQLAFGTTFRVTGGFLKVGTSFLKSISQQQAKTSFLMSIKRQRKIVKSSALKSTDLIFRTVIKYSSRDSIPLKVLTNEKRGGLTIVSFDRSRFKLISRKFSHKLVQAPSCERP